MGGYIGNKTQVALYDSYTKAQADALFPDKTSGTPQDFAAMPSVNGDPVVESGSNSDGEWTRWADGTQVCFTETDIDRSVLQSIIPMPINFGSSLPVVGSYGIGAGTGSTAVVAERAEAYARATTGDWEFYSSGSQTATFPHQFTAIGRWK